MQNFKQLIKDYVDGKLNFDSFNQSWIDMYINQDLSRDLSENEQDFLEEIHEKIEYTVEKPGDDKKWGYISYEDLRNFLETKMRN